MLTCKYISQRSTGLSRRLLLLSFHSASARRHLTAAIICGLSMMGWRATAETSPAAQWSGQVQCTLSLQSDGYAHQETQTWTLTGAPPTMSGSIAEYPATWTVSGQGGSQRTFSNQVIAGVWKTSVTPVNTVIGIGVRASDNRLMIHAYHAQLVSSNGIVGARQVSVAGAAQAPSSQTLPAYEWPLPVMEGDPSTGDVSGSGTDMVSGNVMGPHQAGGSEVANCAWHFTKGSGNLQAASNAIPPAVVVAPVVTPSVTSAPLLPNTTSIAVGTGMTNLTQGTNGTVAKPNVVPGTTLQSASPVANPALTNTANTGLNPSATNTTSVAPTSNGPAVHQAPETTPAYDTVTSTPASFQITLHGITNPPTGYGWDINRAWCDATGCKMMAMPGDTAQVDGQFQTSDEVHVIVGRNGADQTIVSPLNCGGDNDGPNCTRPPFNGSLTLPGGQALYKPTQAWIYVKRGNQHSNLVSFNYAPPMQQVWIRPAQRILSPTSTTAGFGADLTVDDAPSSNAGTDYFGASLAPVEIEHRGGFLGGSKGDDQWFTATLTDGWYIVQFSIDCQTGTCEDNDGLGGGSTLATPFVPGTVHPITVHWWVDANGWTEYTVHAALMVGPQGTNPYQVN